jgi:hypothetical protein
MQRHGRALPHSVFAPIGRQKAADLTNDHEEARVDERCEWIERFEQADIEQTRTNRGAYDLLKSDEDLFPV